MCHSETSDSRGVQHLTLDIHDYRIIDSERMKKGTCHVGSSVMEKSHILTGLRPTICWHHIPRSESEIFLWLNAQSSPLFLTRTYEKDCIGFNTWMSLVLMKETVISVSRVASLLCCCLLHLYVNYLSSLEINKRSLPHRCCDSPSPADTNGTTGNGNQSRENPSTSTQNGGNANGGGSNGDGERNPSGGDGGRDGGSNSGGGDDGGKDDDRNSDSNFGSDDGGEDDVEERDEDDDDKGNETQEEDIDQEATKENTEPPSQLSLVPEAVIEAAGGMEAIDDDKAKLLVRRLQPIYELVDSEQSYGKKLTFVKEKYIPAANEDNPIEIPDDLAPRWRILWGNWIQLYEWHTNFLSKLEATYQTDPDRIPKLFIDSRARLRSIYSKYCENQRKATLIADQYRDFFDDLRVKVGDKEDVQSHLMQPVQRIMRYQLPMGEILKLTQRANLPSASQWQKALDLMKEIPKDTQMILEAARIDGFSGTITALGNMRIRGDLQVATISRSDFHSRRQILTRKDKSSAVHSSGGNGPEGNSGLELKFAERRVFLFEQMLLITEEVKSKRKDVFAQSTYLFKNAVNVNRMRFEPHWLPPDADIDLDDDDLKFVVEDTSPSGDAAYVLDPGSIEVREQWVIQLRDLQRMQQQLLLALQDPKRYVGGGGGPDADDAATGEATPSPTGGSGAVSGLRSFLSGDRGASKKHGSSKAGGKKKKFPSFKKGKQRSKTEELPISVLSASSTAAAPSEGCLDVSNKNTRKESCPNTLHLSVLITPGEKKQVDSRKGTVGSDVHHQASAGALISGRASADLQQANDGGTDGDTIEVTSGVTASGQQHSHQPSKKKFSVFNLFGKNKHHHHHHHAQPGSKDQPTASSPTTGVAATATVCTSDDSSPGAGGNK